jgi:acyl carrier protein
MTSDAKIQATILQLVAEVCGTSAAQVRAEAALVEYGLDSVRAVELAISVEETFGIELSDEALRKLRTAGDLALYVRQMLTTQPATTGP